MNNNQLWKGYAERALVVMKGDYSKERNYKALVRGHCTPSFTDLGTLKGKKWSEAWGMNFDGSVIVGLADNSEEPVADEYGRIYWNLQDQDIAAFRWTSETGMESLGTSNFGGASIAQFVSFDGSVVVGHSDDNSMRDFNVVFRWTAEKGMESLLLNGGRWSYPRGINFDGSVIIGEAEDRSAQKQERAFRWTAENGMESLGVLNGGTWSRAKAISFDGSVIVGTAGDGAAQDQKRAFRWTAENGMESLGVLNDGTWSDASTISLDGSVIVGTADDGAEQKQERAFRWTVENGMESLGTLNERIISNEVKGISFDGSIIVGHAGNSPALKDQRAFQWILGEKGIQPLNDNPRKKWLSSKSSMASFDGSVIVGQAHAMCYTIRAYRWTRESGMNPIEYPLKEMGVLPPEWNWELSRITAITPSGAVFTGEAEGKKKRNAWRAVVPRGNLF